MAVTRIKTNQITDSAVTTAKIADVNVTAGKLEANLTYGSNLTVTGNLTVNGSTTTVDTTNTTVADPFMLLGSGGAGNVDGINVNIRITTGTNTNTSTCNNSTASTCTNATTHTTTTASTPASTSASASINDGTSTSAETCKPKWIGWTLVPKFHVKDHM